MERGSSKRYPPRLKVENEGESYALYLTSRLCLCCLQDPIGNVEAKNIA